MRVTSILVVLILVACSAGGQQHQDVFSTRTVAEFDEPWALAFLPDGSVLVTEKKGRLFVVSRDGRKTPVNGLPEVDYGGQGGFGDVVLHPGFADNRLVYISYVEAGDDDTRGAAVARAALNITPSSISLGEFEVIWRQYPKVSGRGHYGHRLLFSDDGYLFVSSGDRQKFDPAQDMQGNLGKILRLNDDGSTPADNPFADQGGTAAQVWTLGHRNPLGIAFDVDGQLWNTEMGPKGGDELNRVIRGKNYGYPVVSNGDHYSGKDIPDHDTRPEFEAPKAWWTPVISPGGLMVYTGKLFPEWTGDAFIPGLSSEALIRIEFEGDGARESERFEMGKRIRAAVEGPEGALWLLEDGKGGRLLRLTPP